MADNVAITAGTGTTVAADEVVDGTLGTVKVQYVKLMDATLDGTTKAAVGANGLAADVKASVLPTGASTSALQTTGNTSVASIDTKTPALGQALAAASVPVILPSATITTLTPPSAVGINAGSAIIGKVTTDQTTHGTTDLVAADNTKIAGTAVDTNSGVKSSGTQRIVIATDQPSLTNAQPIKGGTLEAAGLSAGSLNAFLIASTDVSAYKSWSLQVSGTWSGNLTFLGSNDNVTFYSVQAVNMNNSTSTQTTTTTSSNGLFSGTIGFRYLAVQMTSYSSGTATGVAEYYAVANPNHYMGVGAAQYGNWQTQLTDGTNTANVLKSDGTAAGQNSLITTGAYLANSAASAGALNADFMTLDMGNYRYVSIVISASAYVGTLSFQGSNDNFATTTSIYLQRSDNNTGTTGSNTTGTSIAFTGYIPTRYFRVRMTAYTSGTAQGSYFVTSQPAYNTTQNQQVQQSGTWAVGSNSATGSAVPANAFYIGLNNSGNLAGLNSNTTDSAGGSTQLATGMSAYNNASWDRVRNNYNTTTGDTGAKTTSFAGATQTNYNQQSAYIYVLCGTVSGTTPTMTAQLQWSPDAGTTWVNLGPATSTITTTGNSLLIAVGPENFSQTAGATPANLTTGATAQVMINAPLPRTWRLNYTITGTTPSFAITAAYVNYQGV